MKKEEVLGSFCALSSEVGDHLKNQFACDCFCGLNKMSDKNFQFQKEVLDFICQAVKEKISRDSEEKSKTSLETVD